MKKLKKLIVNAMILTCTSLLLRTVSVAFNVYISNKIGTQGMGLLSLIGTVYSFALTFATSGIFIASTKLTSAALGRNSPGEVRAAMKKCLIYALSFGSASLFLLFLFAPIIGTHILKDMRAVIPLRIFALTLPLISCSSAMNGYFSAVRRVYKNAVSQVFEQSIKIALTVYLLSAVISSSLESACIAIAASGAIAELCSFIVTYIGFLADKRKYLKHVKSTGYDAHLTRELLAIALPTAFSSYARSGLSTIEHILIPRGLELNGTTRERSLSAYGTLQSMVMPIVLFPSAIISSFSSLLIPEITECCVIKNHIEIKYIVSRVFQLSLLFSIGVAGTLICFSGELGIFIYDSTEAGRYIKMIAPLVPIMYMDTTTDAILKGMGDQVFTMNVNILDSALGVFLVIILLPPYGIAGYIALIYICETINAVLGISRLLIRCNFEPRIFKCILGPLLCIGGATACIKMASYTLRFHTLSSGVGLGGCILFTTLIYFIFARIFGCISKDDITWLCKIIKK